MRQVEIQFFWSLTEQVPLDLDYANWYMFPPGQGADQTETPRGFYQWAVENKYKCGTQQHPMEQAHSDAADLIKGKFNELVTKRLQ